MDSGAVLISINSVAPLGMYFNECILLRLLHGFAGIISSIDRAERGSCATMMAAYFIFIGQFK
jgi:hypothetical protein